MSDETQVLEENGVTTQAVWNEEAKSFDKVPIANGSPTLSAPTTDSAAQSATVLKKALRPRDRSAFTYDALFELEGAENVVFACDTLPLEESEAFQAAEMDFRKTRQAKNAALDNPALSEDEARDIVTELRLLAESHNQRIDDLLRTYLKGEGVPGGKVYAMDEEARTDFTPGVKADIALMIIARSSLSENDAAFLSRRSR